MSPGPIWLFVALGCVAAGVSAVAPVEVAMVGVLVFAGPHNLLELRYLLARLPSRPGVFRSYFVVATGGLVVLSLGSLALAWVGHTRPALPTLGTLAAVWYTALVGWIAVLLGLRRRERSVRSVEWIAPTALLVAGFAWWSPGLTGLALVYAHPLVALWFLDRELRARHRNLRPHYHTALCLVPAALALIWWLGPVPELHAGVSPAVADAILRQSGAHLLAADPGRRMIASHTFLELLHYGVWIVVLPLVAVRGRIWRLRDIPLGRRSPWFAAAIGGLMLASAAAAVALWVGFSIDYAATRDLYFTVAIVHVLVEAPALIRLT